MKNSSVMGVPPLKPICVVREWNTIDPVLSHPAKFSFAEHINENIINQKKEND
jgi:hypothetical protein